MPRRSRAADVSQCASWAEELNQYTNRKLHSAPEAYPIKRFTRKDGSGFACDARDFNIVTCVASSPQVAESYSQCERATQSERAARAIKKEIEASGRGYDLLTMCPRYGLTDAEADHLASTVGDGGSCAKRRGGGSDVTSKSNRPAARRTCQTEYDIVTNQPKLTSAAGVEGSVADGTLNSGAAELKKAKKRSLPERQTNIITHRYTKDHEVRAAADHQKMEEYVNAVACRMNPLNPITGKFTNVDEEAEAQCDQAAKEADCREKVKTHTYNVSRIVARSEGHAFDIVTNQVYNPSYVLKLEQNNCKGVLQRAAQRQGWEYQRDVEEALRNSDAQRALQRVSAERLLEQQRRGHHVLTNQPFGLSREEEAAGKSVDPTLGQSQAKPPLSMSCLKPASVMDRLEKTTQRRVPCASEVLRESGPRTTYERVFNSSPTPIAASISTFKGRQELLLPTIAKCRSEPQLRQQFSQSSSTL